MEDSLSSRKLNVKLVNISVSVRGGMSPKKPMKVLER